MNAIRYVGQSDVNIRRSKAVVNDRHEYQPRVWTLYPSFNNAATNRSLDGKCVAWTSTVIANLTHGLSIENYSDPIIVNMDSFYSVDLIYF